MERVKPHIWPIYYIGVYLYIQKLNGDRSFLNEINNCIFTSTEQTCNGTGQAEGLRVAVGVCCAGEFAFDVIVPTE